MTPSALLRPLLPVIGKLIRISTRLVAPYRSSLIRDNVCVFAVMLVALAEREKICTLPPHLCPGLSRRLRLCGHRPLKLNRQPDVLSATQIEAPFECSSPLLSSPLHLHLHPLHFYSPRIGGFVETRLHDVRDGFPLGEDLGQVLGAQHVSKGGRRQQPRRMAVEAGSMVTDL